MPDHNDFFRGPSSEEYYADQMQEQPSTERKWRIRHNRITNSFTELRTKLSKDLNMDLIRSNSDKNILIVSGIPPYNGFSEGDILKVVNKYDPSATVVPK